MPTIGTCSNCKGPVQTPELWSGDLPPVPTCASCGATAKNPYGPVIPMTPTQPRMRTAWPSPILGDWKP